MTAYIKSTDFAVKDVLLTGNPSKLVKGSEVNTEFDNIQLADATNVKQTSNVGSAIIPAGATTQRDISPSVGYQRFNTTTQMLEVYGASGWQGGGGSVCTVEVQTSATSQTVFTLSNSYVPSTNTIQVYVDGLLKLPTSYTETSTNIITFTSGLTLGSKVEFVVFGRSIGAVDAANSSYLPAGTGAVATTVQGKLRMGSVSNHEYRQPGDADDTASIQRALAASLDVSITGNLTVSGTGTLFNIRAGQHITCNATITHSATSGIVFSAVGVDDWVIDGQLAVYGAGNTNATQTALYIAGCNRYKVYNLLAANIAGWGIKIDPGAYVAPYADNGKFFGCISYNCYYGLEGAAGTGAEFIEFFGYTSVLCTYGTVVSAGNWQFLGGHDVQNVNGFTLLSGSNNAHGQCVGRAFNHNSSYNFRANGVTNGWVNVGCNAYGDGPSLGYIWLTDSKGITWIGGNIDSPILLDGTTTYCKISNANIPGAYSVVTGARAHYLQVENCYTPSGGLWSYNDPAFCYVLANRTTSTQSAAGGATIVFNNEQKDNREAYDPATGIFTAPATAWYTLSINLTITGTSISTGYAEIKKNGSTVSYVPVVLANGGSIAVASASLDIALTSGDTITCTSTVTGTTPLIAVDTSWLSIASKG